MTSDYIIDVSEDNFENEVLVYSQKSPVVVDFWAEWCAPCKTLGPLLERLTQEAQGSFRLAKLNVDNSPNIALRFGVHNIPALKAFRNNQIVGEFIGMQPEARLREFLHSIAPSQNELMLEKAHSLLRMGQAESAEQVFRSVIGITPESPSALLGLAKCHLMQGRGSDALTFLEKINASKEYHSAGVLRPLAEELISVKLDESITDQPLAAFFNNSVRLAERGNFEAAMDGLLDILREDKQFSNGRAHRLMLAILELLGDENPNIRQYRSELASVLF